MSLATLRNRLNKLEQRRRVISKHVIFAYSRDDAHAQADAMIRLGTASDHDDFVMFVTTYEERPQ